MSEANELYLKISYKSKESFNNPLIIKQDMKEGINKYKVCGGMYSKNSRAIIFKINNLEEAYDVVNSTFITGSDKNKYEVKYKLLYMSRKCA